MNVKCYDSIPETHSRFARLYRRMLVTIHIDVSAMQIRCVHPATVVKKESAKIYVKRLSAVQELDAILENVFVLPDTLVHRTIQTKDVTFMINVTSIKIASRRKFASKLLADHESVSMAVVDSNVDRTLYVSQRTIVRRVFVATVTSEIQATLKWAARNIVVLWTQTAANRTEIVKKDTFALSM